MNGLKKLFNKHKKGENNFRKILEIYFPIWYKIINKSFKQGG